MSADVEDHAPRVGDVQTKWLRFKGLVWRYGLQGSTSLIDAHSDADGAGSRETRKLTSGGTLVIGGHLIRTYLQAQSVSAKSSGESELYGVVCMRRNRNLAARPWPGGRPSKQRNGCQLGDGHQSTRRAQQGETRMSRHDVDPRAASSQTLGA